MIPPSSMATSTSPSSSDAVVNSKDKCDHCNSRDSWVIHKARLRGTLRSFCTNCLLRNHPASFCPSCFAFYDSSPPHPSRRVSCSKCLSLTHTQCAPDAKVSSYLCPPCRSPNSFSFFRPIIGPDGVRSVDKSLSEAFYCAAKIAASSMNKAVYAFKCDSERRGKEAALARKRAREALEHVVELDMKEKARLVLLTDQKPKLNLSSNVTVTETTPTTKNNGGGTEKQSPAKQLGTVKKESDGSK